jgi:hypothetical protein
MGGGLNPAASAVRLRGTPASDLDALARSIGGAVGSSNAVCGAKRARPSVFESKHFSNSVSSVCISGT